MVILNREMKKKKYMKHWNISIIGNCCWKFYTEPAKTGKKMYASKYCSKKIKN